MTTLVRRGMRLLPALLIAIGVMVITAGLLTLDHPALDRPASPAGLISTPTPAASIPAATTSIPTLTAAPVATATTQSPEPGATPTPGATPEPEPSPIPAGIASRIRIPSLDIDLPIVPSNLQVPGNPDLYPLCDVAMYLIEFVQPGEAGSTYVYAHAQRGMFLPLLQASEVNDGAQLIGAQIELYTSDARVHVYEITRVKRHATDLALAVVGPGEHQLVLQTSEGPSGTVPKLQIAARPVSTMPATPEDANPRPRPRVCLPSG